MLDSHMRGTSLSISPSRFPNIDWPGWLMTGLLLLLAFAVLSPLVLLIQASLEVPSGSTVQSGLGQLAHNLLDPTLLEAAKNTFSLTFTQQAFSLPIALVLSWLLGRTDMPGRRWIEVGFWLAFFAPTLAVLQGWILLLAPNYGLVNQATVWLFGLKTGPFDIFSWWGIVFAHLITTSVAAKVMLMTPVFRNFDGSFEEAARMSGDTTAAAIWRIVIPVLAPVILVTTITGLIYALESFEIELVLGGPSNIYVYSTLIYREVRASVPDYAGASAIGLLMIPIIALLASVPRLITRNRNYSTMSSRARFDPVRLGIWRWPAFGFAMSCLTMLTLLPLVMLVCGSFMSLFGFFKITPMLTLEHWIDVLGDSGFIRSLMNTVKLALGTAVFASALCFINAYVIARTRFWGRSWIDFLSWVPFTMPGILFSLAILWLVLQVPFLRPLYGTTSLLVIVIGMTTLTVGTQIIKTSLQQLGDGIEQASWISGHSWFSTVRNIVIPISVHTIIVVAVMGFITAARNIGHIALLVSSDNQPLALLQLEFMVEGRFEAASVVGIIVLALTVGVTIIVRYFGFRIGPQHG